jgi:hypothetical protein
MSGLDWQTIASIGAVLIATLAILDRRFDKSLSLREHAEFKESMRNRLDGFEEALRAVISIREHAEWKQEFRSIIQDWITQFRLDLGRVETGVMTLDQSKPTTGELELATEALEKRLELLEKLLSEKVR